MTKPDKHRSNCGFKRKSVRFVLVAAIFSSGCAERDTLDATAGPAAEVAGVAVIEDQQVRSRIVDFSLGDPITTCNIETINGDSLDGTDADVRKGDDPVVAGWMIPPDSATPEDWALYADFGGGGFVEFSSLARVARPDLAGLAPDELIASAGFSVQIALPKGFTGRVGLFLAPMHGDPRIHCALGRGFRVLAP